MKLNASQFNSLLRRIIKEEKSKKKIIKETVFRTLDLARINPEAFEALPDVYKADDALNFWYDPNGDLCAEHDLQQGSIACWSPKYKNWDDVSAFNVNESKKMKTKTTLSEVRKVIKEEVVRYSVKRKLTEAVKRYFRLNEMVSWKDLQGELKTAYDHFKAENPSVKIGDFDFKKVTDSFINDPEARQMMKDGDADGLVNKAFDVLGADVVGDTDVEKQQDDVFANLDADDKEIESAFDNLTKKAS